jgi:tetratricopeptide (TPR) repeat protein
MARTVTPKVAALIERGMQLVRAGDFAEAGRSFERALQQMPELAEVHAMRADALMRAERLEPALASAERALRLQPAWGEALMLRGNIEALLERYPAAEASFRQALQLGGPGPSLQANLGNVLFEQQRFAEALEAYDQALRGNPAADLLARRAKTLFALGRLDEATQAWEAVLERDPASLEAMEQLLLLYMGARRMDDLARLCARGGALAPRDPAFRIGEGWLAAWAGDDEASIEKYRQAATLAPKGDKLHHEAVLSEAMGLFKLGRWQEGWSRYLWRQDRDLLREVYPRLASDPGTIASAAAPLRIRVHFEQGLGDELFFLRFAPLVKARGHHLTYCTAPRLIALLEGQAHPFDRLVPSPEADPSPCDVELQTSDLALASGAGLAPPLPLLPEAARCGVMLERLRAFGPPPYVGVTWRAGLLPEEQLKFRDKPIWLKRTPAEMIGGLLRPARATVVILQRRPDPQERAQFLAALGREALDASDSNDDLRDALALLSLLDEYIGPSNTNMHLLAGLTGKKARVLLQMPPEWRWTKAGDESPWFPGFVLYRQDLAKSWEAAFARLRSDLGL